MRISFEANFRVRDFFVAMTNSSRGQNLHAFEEIDDEIFAQFLLTSLPFITMCLFWDVMWSLLL